MDDPPKDPDAKALDAISDSPPRPKSKFYSQQLPRTTGSHHPRNHSIDGADVVGDVGASDEDDFYRYPVNHAADAAEDAQMLPNEPLPEFIGSGGGVGVFKAPVRAAMHPTRPPCIEIRPHPLRESQVGYFCDF